MPCCGPPRAKCTSGRRRSSAAEAPGIPRRCLALGPITCPPAASLDPGARGYAAEVTFPNHPGLRCDLAGPVLTLTLCNPAQLNAQTPSLWAALADTARAVPADVRVVVIRAEGRSFSAGLNRSLLAPGGMPGEPDMLAAAASSAADMTAMIGPFQEGFSLWREVPAVVVAAVQGHAIGAGFQLALAADIRVVADDVKFAMKEIALGLVPDLGGTSTLVHTVGYGRALEICATGRTVGAAEAVALGIASMTVPADELDSATGDLVSALLAVPSAPLRALKPLMRQSLTATPDEQLVHERTAQGQLLHDLARMAGLGGPGASTS